MIDLELNSGCRTDIRIVGDERTPVVVLDDPIQSVEPLLEYARQEAGFDGGDEFAYPGIRARLPEQYGKLLVEHIVGLIRHLYNPPRSSQHQVIHQLFSLVTRRPDELAPLQRIPHTDDRHPFYFATVHYLNPGEHSGTGFFRHRPTGFERISADRYPALVQTANEHMKANGLPPEKYINDSDDHFELLEGVDYRQNRLVLYPGNLLHSGLIRPDKDISEDPASGRLTANLFFYFP